MLTEHKFATMEGVIIMTNWRSLGHRGDETEDIINLTNDLYERHQLALMKKIAIPIKVTKIEGGRIAEGFYEEKSTVDYIGIIQGTAVCFDAKETFKSNLPLQNIHPHQLKYMQDFRAQGGVSFVLCNFKTYSDFRLIPLEVVEAYMKNCEAKGRKSIPYAALDPQFSIRLNENGTLAYIEKIDLYMKLEKLGYFEDFQRCIDYAKADAFTVDGEVIT